jgi:mono/diheme cytochrome c family protein
MKNIRSSSKYLGPAVPLAIFLLGSLLAWAQAATSPQSAGRTPSPPAQHAKPAATNPGERAFQANCGRCHNPPEQLSPRITGTVLRHMRERALLSPQDERDILKFLAP